LLKGTAHFSLHLPPDAQEGDKLEYEVEITDPSRIEPFLCPFRLTVLPARVDVPKPPAPTPIPTPPSENKGSEHAQSSLLGIPNPEEVYEHQWADHDLDFDRTTAVVIAAAPGQPEDRVVYDYHINMDNVHLARAIREAPKKQQQMRRQYKLGMTILALAVVQQSLASGQPTAATTDDDDEGKQEWNAADQVRLFTSAMSPFLIPMVESLANLPDEEEAFSASAGEAA
jgi:hypothetical protein